MKLNPYIAGNPVGGGDAFIGRADVLREVVRVLRNPGENALVLYGQRRIGKTSVLQELLTHLPEKGAYCPVYFDLQDKAARPLAEVLAELAARVADELGLPPPQTWGEATPRAFREDFIPVVLADLPPETSLVLLFDEFDVLDNPGEAQAGAFFFPYLRDLLSLDPRLQFIFVIGRRPEDLSSLTLSVFKGVKSRSVSLMSSEETANLVRLAERNNTLHWLDEAVTKVYALTGGHPFLTQQLCQEVWERAYQDEPEESPTVSYSDAEAAAPVALSNAKSALEWLWDGLKPAQRIVASALAESGTDAISQDELNQRLLDSGVRILIGELQDAPRMLQEWDLIEPVKNGYHFQVELLRRWIAERKPLARVQEEIDRIQPVADNLFQAAYNLYQGGQLEQAIPLLRQAIGFNPNHSQANQLLAEILLAQGELTEARQLLESFYQYRPDAARPRLVQVLLLQARISDDEKEKLSLYERILELEPRQPEAIYGKKQILGLQVNKVLIDRNWNEAVQILEQVEDNRRLSRGIQRIGRYVEEKNYHGALILTQQLDQSFFFKDDLLMRLAAIIDQQTEFHQPILKTSQKEEHQIYPELASHSLGMVGILFGGIWNVLGSIIVGGWWIIRGIMWGIIGLWKKIDVTLSKDRERLQQSGFNEELQQLINQLQKTQKNLKKRSGEVIPATDLNRLENSLTYRLPEARNISQLRQEISGKIAYLKEREREVKELKARLSEELKGKMPKQLLSDFRGILTEIDKTKDEVIDYNKKLEEQRDTARNFADKHKEFKEKVVKEREFINKKVDKYLQEFDQKFVELKQNVEQYKQDLQRKTEERDPTIKNQLQVFDENIKRFVADKDDLRNIRDQYEMIITQTENKLENLNGKIEQLRTELYELERIDKSELSDLEERWNEILSFGS